MAIASTTDWVVRDSGNANNGGGFSRGASGTNFTNQDSAQYALTGVTSSGAGNTVLTASAAADMVGNVGQVISGTNFNTGFFPILSVVVGVSITFDTKNGGSSICTGVGASGVINIGGALLTIAAALAAGVNGNLYYVKGTFTISSSLSIPYDCTGSVALASQIIGFTTTPGDGGQATITTATNSTTLIANGGFTGWGFENLILSNTASTRGIGIVAGGNSFLTTFNNCVFDGFTDAVNGDNLGHGRFFFLYMQDCEIKNCSGKGITQAGSTDTYLRGCNIHNNGSGILMEGTFAADFCAISFNTGKGFEQDVGGQNNPTTFTNCCIRDNGSDGIKITSAPNPYPLFVWNNIFWNNTGFGINFTNNRTAASTYSHSNAFGSNGSGATHNWPQGTGAVTLTADPNTNASGNDYTLNNTAGGGAALKAAGYQSSILG